MSTYKTYVLNIYVSTPANEENQDDEHGTNAGLAVYNQNDVLKPTKQKLTLSIDKDIIERAKDAGINISAITEKVLDSLTMDVKGATRADVLKGYEDLFAVIQEALKKYNASVNVGVTQGDEPDEEGYMTGDDIILTTYGLSAKDFKGKWRTVQIEEVEKYGQFWSPFEILQNLLKALVTAAESNREELKELNIALRFVKALSTSTDSNEVNSLRK